MYKNFTLTDEERKEILEQHASHGYKKPLNEQTTVDMTIIQDRTIKIKNYLGKTANLYSDPQNTKFVRQIPFESMWVEKDGTVIIRFNESTGQSDYAYSCSKPNQIETKNWYSSEKPESFYSNNLTPKLQQDFCTTSVGNAPVPNATFASNKSNPSNLAQ